MQRPCIFMVKRDPITIQIIQKFLIIAMFILSQVRHCGKKSFNNVI